MHQEQAFDTPVDIDSMHLWSTHKRLCMTHATDEATRNLETPTGIEYSSPRQCCNPTKPVRTDGATCHYFRLCAGMTTAPSHLSVSIRLNLHRKARSRDQSRCIRLVRRPGRMVNGMARLTFMTIIVIRASQWRQRCPVSQSRKALCGTLH